MKHILITIIIMISTPAHAWFDDWDNVDKGLYIGSVIASAADMYTTNRTIKHNDYRMSDYGLWQKENGHENNPLLPDYPSTTRLIMYGVICSAGVLIVADLLPSRIRKVFLLGCISIEIGYARRNSVTIKTKF